MAENYLVNKISEKLIFSIDFTLKTLYNTIKTDFMRFEKRRIKNMAVDRSYSPYEVIRAYHDRGMMKWGAFATGELKEAENRRLKEIKEDKALQRQPYNKVFHLLNRSFGNQVQIKIQFQSSGKINQIYGFVSEFVDIHQVRVKSTNKIYLIKIEEILNIYSIDDIF